MRSLIQYDVCSRCGLYTEAAPLGDDEAILCFGCVAKQKMPLDEIVSRLMALAIVEAVVESTNQVLAAVRSGAPAHLKGAAEIASAPGKESTIQ